MSSDGLDPVDAIGLLSDPLRRRLFNFVRERQVPVSRDEAAQEAGISRKLAAFHLDKLVEAGLVEVAAGPTTLGRRLGRPPKHYRPAPVDLVVSLPERRYELMGRILVDAIVASGRDQSARDAAVRAGGETGARLGLEALATRRPGRLGPERAISAARAALGELGFEPVRTSDGGLLLRNCPFQALAQQAPELICAVNHAFTKGLVRGLGNESVSVVLSPSADRCCVTLGLPIRSA